MNQIARGSRKIRHVHSESPLLFVDYFVDGSSFEDTLRNAFGHIFSKGRYRETQVPTLGNKLDPALQDEAISGNFLPDNHASKTCLIYCCHDGCCGYGYVKVVRRDGIVTWEKFGVNAAFMENAKEAASTISWLEEFDPLHFRLQDYLIMLRAFKS